MSFPTRTFHTTSPKPFPRLNPDDLERRLQCLKASMARDQDRAARMQARLRDKRPISDQEFYEMYREFMRDRAEDFRNYPVMSFIATFLTIATMVAPVGLVLWWMGWWPFSGRKVVMVVVVGRGKGKEGWGGIMRLMRRLQGRCMRVGEGPRARGIGD